ncbi:MAG: DUF6186 family protein [Acidimicrobiales bacterium]
MTWAEVTYGLWAAIALAALVLWLASAHTWRVGRIRIRRPSAALRDALGTRTWLRVAVVVGWAWLGIHVFAR